MKRALLLTLIALLGLGEAKASDTFTAINDDGVTIYYKIVSSTDLTCEVVENPQKYKGKLSIPATVTYNNKTYTVTRIDYYAFDLCTEITTIHIPNTLIDIPTNKPISTPCAISTNPPTEGFVVDADNPNYSSEDGCLFNKDKSILYRCPIGKQGEYKIPETVNVIRFYAFYNCSELTSIIIPEGVTVIGGNPYEESYSYSFYYPYYYGYVFANCSKLTAISLPKGIKRIDKGTFFRCHSLTSIEIPDSVSIINSTAFDDCENLLNINVGSLNSFYCSVDGALYTKDKTKLVRCPEGKSGIFNLEICVDTIALNAFNDCNNITEINISRTENLYVDNDIFGSCANIQKINIDEENAKFSSVDGVLYNKEKTNLIRYPRGKSGEYIMPNSVDSMQYYAFEDCSKIQTIDINKNIKEFYYYYLDDCSNLKAINVDEDNETYSSIDGVLFDKETSTLLCFPANRSDEYVVPDGVGSIADGAFQGCKSLKKIEIPSSVAEINGGAFYKCKSLNTIYSYIETPFEFDEYVFGDSVYASATLYVPVGTKEKYKSTKYWNKFGKISEMGVTHQVTVTSSEWGNVGYGDDSWTDDTRTFTVEDDDKMTFTITPNAGCEIDSFTVNGNNRKWAARNGSYTLSNIGEDQIVKIKFRQKTYDLKFTASSLGTIAFGDSTISDGTKTIAVLQDSAATIRLLPDERCKLDTLWVNGEDVTADVSDNSYTIKSVTRNTTIVAHFSIKKHTLSIQATGGGQANYEGEVWANATKEYTLDEGSSATIYVYPFSGYTVRSLTVNGEERRKQITDNTLTLDYIDDDTEIVVTFGVPTSINSVETDDATTKRYNLRGQRINSRQRGIYIENGRKIVKK